MTAYTQTVISGLTITIPAEVNFGDFFLCGMLIAISLVGLALIAVEVFA